jgi:hypothetical protein
MTSKTIQIALLIWIFCSPIQKLFSQATGNHTSRELNQGAWETPGTWDPEWPSPSVNIQGAANITINGYVTAASSLNFTSAVGLFMINDTLVINGDLTLGNNADLTLNDNAIIIIIPCYI